MTLRIGSIALRQNRQETFEKRAQSITRMAVDSLIIAGFRTGMDGMQLRGTLDRLGLIYQTSSDADPDESAVILAARCPFVEIDLPSALAPHRRCYLHVGIADFRLMACDLMDVAAAAALQSYLLSQAEGLLRDKALLLCRPAISLQTPAKPSTAAPDLATKLMAMGYLDAHQLTPQLQEAAAAKERPAFNSLVTPALAPQMSDCYRIGDDASPPEQGWGTAILRVG